MTDNLSIWTQLAKSDPEHTSKFKRAGGFSGTSLKPIWMTHRMTEIFGPCGVGWGMTKPEFQTVPAGEETLVYCTVGLWHGKPNNLVYGVGGDKAVSKNKYGFFADDEAFKKSYTDALSNAMKQIGMAADIHMGQHDDDKYVAAMKQEFKGQAEAPKTGNPPGITAFRAKLRDFYRELHSCTDYDQYVAFVNSPDAQDLLKVAREQFPNDWNGDGGDVKGLKRDMQEIVNTLKEKEAA